MPEGSPRLTKISTSIVCGMQWVINKQRNKEVQAEVPACLLQLP